MAGKYDDILYLPHHVSDHHPHMRLADRAAQFAPFAALTGFGSTIVESGRLTDARKILDENVLARLDERLSVLDAALASHPEVKITYFEKDLFKEGGSYPEYHGTLRRIDYSQRILIFTDGHVLPIDDICRIESPLFEDPM